MFSRDGIMRLHIEGDIKPCQPQNHSVIFGIQEMASWDSSGWDQTVATIETICNPMFQEMASWDYRGDIKLCWPRNHSVIFCIQEMASWDYRGWYHDIKPCRPQNHSVTFCIQEMASWVYSCWDQTVLATFKWVISSRAFETKNHSVLCNLCINEMAPWEYSENFKQWRPHTVTFFIQEITSWDYSE